MGQILTARPGGLSGLGHRTVEQRMQCADSVSPRRLADLRGDDFTDDTILYDADRGTIPVPRPNSIYTRIKNTIRRLLSVQMDAAGVYNRTHLRNTISRSSAVQA